MGDNVLVSVCGIQTTAGVECDPVEVVSRGERFEKGGKIYVIYDEIEQEDTSQNEGKIVKNQIKIADDTVAILKRGESATHMVFTEGETSVTYYNTPYGNLEISLCTKSLEKTITDSQIDISIAYDLMVDGSVISGHRVKISVKSC